MRPLNDPALVREQYAGEDDLRARKAIYSNAEGPDARELALQAVAEVAPATVLEVGGGEGELAERIVQEVGVELVLVDQSERMVELSRERGLDARVADVQSLPFADESFDCTVAAWMLYHAADVALAISELARVMRPGGRLVAVTNGAGHLAELRELAGEGGWWTGLPFSRENGAEQLARSFSHVEARHADGWVSIPDDDAIWAYLRSMMSLVSPPAELPPHELPYRVQRKPTVFVATK
jgi:SAM-dependent methyltransferase